MSVEYNEFVLSTAYWEGFITEARYNASKKALLQHPELLALDLIRHQNWLQPEQLQKLEAALAEAIAKAEAAAAATAVPVPNPQPKMAAGPKIVPSVAPQPSVATPRPVVAQPTPQAVPAPRPAMAQPSVAQPSVPTAHAVPTPRPCRCPTFRRPAALRPHAPACCRTTRAAINTSCSAHPPSGSRTASCGATPYSAVSWRAGSPSIRSPGSGRQPTSFRS